MKTVEIYDPAMCCSSGVCGPAPDQSLAAFAGTLEKLKAAGVSSRRYSLAQEPLAFVRNPAVNAVLQKEGESGLPLVLIDGEIRFAGAYPTYDQLAESTGLSAAPGDGERFARALPKGFSFVKVNAPKAMARGCCDPASGCCGTPSTSEDADLPNPLQNLLDTATPFLLFTGKGGVGKTSLASATAVALADAGKRVLLVSTDPASNLDEVLAVKLGPEPIATPEAPGLFALNIDPTVAAAAYRERIVGPIRGVLPEATVRNIEEQLSGACTAEIASFNEFSRLLGDESAVAEYDHVILDTAPTGHTLRLLALPAAWTSFIDASRTGSSCLGPLSGLAEQRGVYENALAALRDPERTTIALVARADAASLKEASRASGDLAAIGIQNQSLILNAIFKASDSGDALAAAMQLRAETALANLPSRLKDFPRFEIPFRTNQQTGVESLRSLLGKAFPAAAETPRGESESYPEVESLIQEIAATGHGVVMVMGKGGVGKTTLSKRIAIRLAEMGHSTLLTTTDPANHISDIDISNTPNLSVSAIDPKEATRQHVEDVLATAGKDLDADARALLEEELRSPCTEEIAVFTAFAHEVEKGEDRFVVLDTAPTGHTLLLLDATEAYHREVLKNAAASPEAVRRLLPRLRDPNFCKVVIAALPEATPVHEAAQLQEDLRRAGIEPFAWIVNQCIYGSDTSDPLLLTKGTGEKTYLDEVAQRHAKRFAAELWQADPLRPVAFQKLSSTLE